MKALKTRLPLTRDNQAQQRLRSVGGEIVIAFSIRCVPPSITSQQKRAARTAVGIRFFKSSRQAAAEADLISLLRPHAPASPLVGALAVRVELRWPFRKSERAGVVRAGLDVPHTGKPDIDNAVKALLDCMTRLAFWRDDSQVSQLTIVKAWSAQRTRRATRAAGVEPAAGR